MKASFFFVLWIIIYPLIEIFGTPYMIEHSFFIALVTVLIINWICNNRFSDIFEQVKERELLSFYELVYTDNFVKFKEALLRGFMFPLATSIYLVISAVTLLLIGVPIWETVLFAFLAIGSCNETIKKYNIYKELTSGGKIHLPEELEEEYANYAAERETRTFEEICSEKTTGYKVMRGANFVFSVLAVLLGLFMLISYLPLLFIPDVPILLASMMISYGFLAVIYGIGDFISTYKGYSFSI